MYYRWAAERRRGKAAGLVGLAGAILIAAVLGGGCTSPAFAQDEPGTPKIEGFTTFKQHTLVKMKLTGLGKDDSVLWKVRPLDAANEGKVQITKAGTDGPDVEGVAPPGRYRVEAIIGRQVGGRFRILGDETVITIEGVVAPEPAPAPKPKPDPTPDPNPKPKPAPDNDEADAVLAAKFAAALGAGEKAGGLALGKVYSEYAAVLTGSTDPALRPKTVRQSMDRLLDASVAAGVPRLPALQGVRRLVAAEVGEYDAMAVMTDALTAELAGKYKRVGAALQAACK